jgi:oxygen-independent coproporphyrinogen-3 oxidase
MSVYVHIPFCDYRCRYCNFTFETGWSPQLLDRTLNALVDQARREVDRAGHDGLQLNYHTLYMGGGTPGVIPPEKLGPFADQLNAALGTSQSIWAESGFEVNPENVTADYLAALAEAGVTRLSLGIQSFVTARLEVLGRWCTREVNLRALELIATHWKGTWSADLMTGLPGDLDQRGQTWTELKADLTTLLNFAPPHVSLYSLTVEPETALHSMVRRKKLQLSTPGQQDQLWLRAREHLLAQGFEWYEISNFARPKHRSLHNPVYWRLDPWMGLGPGAEGNLVARTPEGDWRPLRTRNARLFPWLAKTGGATTAEFLTAPEFYLEHFLTGWRTSEGVSAQRLARVFDHLPPHHARQLTDAQRLTLNGHLERLDGFHGVEYALNWFRDTKNAFDLSGPDQ